jgi:nicotinate-nucleotide pyrophosphorylase
MPKFTVRATYVAEVEVEVEAKNKEDAYEKVDALNLDQWEMIGWDNFMIEEIEEANHGRD